MKPTRFFRNLFHMGTYDLLAELNDAQRQIQSLHE